MTQDNKAVQAYGSREDIKEIAYRLKTAMPGGKKLNDDEALALAQITQVSGLNAITGEVWYIPGKGPMVGIKGLRKSAKQQIKAESGPDANYWVEFKNVAPENEGDIVYEAHLRDTATISSWADAFDRLNKVGMPNPVDAGLGPAPVTIGVGLVKKGESSRMEPHALAKKRAEADAIKQRFDVEFAGYSDSPGIIDAEVVDVPKKAEVVVGGDFLDSGGLLEALESPSAPSFDVMREEPMKPKGVRVMVERLLAEEVFSNIELTVEQRAYIWGEVQMVCTDLPIKKDEMAPANIVIDWLLGKEIHEAHDAEVMGLATWLGVTLDMGGHPLTICTREAQAIWKEATFKLGDAS